MGFLEEKGYVAREKFANAYRYHALVPESDFAGQAVDLLVQKFYDSSYARMVSRFVKDEKMDLAELKALIAEIEREG